MMDFELQLSRPSRKYSCLEGVAMGVSYFIGILNCVRKLQRCDANTYQAACSR
jgi:hypothetical protein